MANTFRFDGMTCNGCARAVENAVKSLVPAATVKVDLAGQTVSVEGVEERDLPRTVRNAVEEADFVYGGPLL